MAHSRGTGITNRGDAWRVTCAAGAFVIELLSDLRVEALYAEWCRARDFMDHKTARFLDVTPKANRPRANAVLRNFELQYNELARAQTQRFVKERLGLEDGWVADWLIEAFRLQLQNARRAGGDPQRFAVPVTVPADMPKGKAPAHDGQEIERNVRWYYRAHVKQPADSIHQLAREYEATLGEGHSDSRSVIRNGIQQARALLDAVNQHSIRIPNTQ